MNTCTYVLYSYYYGNKLIVRLNCISVDIQYVAILINKKIIMNCWLISLAYVISTCTATRILYILPDNVSEVNCPSQPCATLVQYLLDNGSLPVLSNVEYHFLPGEHHVVDAIYMEGAINFSLVFYQQN